MLTAESVIYLSVGFMIGSFFATVIFVYVNSAKNNKLVKLAEEKRAIISSIGKKCAMVDNFYSEYRMGKLDLANLQNSVLANIEEINSKLMANSDKLDPYYIQNIQRFISDQKNFLIGDENPQQFGGTRTRTNPIAVEPQQITTTPAEQQPQEFKRSDTAFAGGSIIKQPTPNSDQRNFEDGATTVISLDEIEQYSGKQSSPEQDTKYKGKEAFEKGATTAININDLPSSEPNSGTEAFVAAQQTQIYQNPIAQTPLPPTPPKPVATAPQPDSAFPQTEAQESYPDVDIDATQIFNVNDILPSGSNESQPATPPPQVQQPQQRPSPKQNGDNMISGNDVMDQMDNFFNF